MHQRLVNYCTIDLHLIPQGPILIKAGENKKGTNPSKPDMEFVETYHQGGRSIYLPGSSLKGAIRAQAERIVRTVGSDRRPNKPDQLWASNPLKLDDYQYLDEYKDSRDLYHHSSFTDQLFGSPYIGSRIRIEDAYPVDRSQLKIEARNGVAIDRVFGSAVRGALYDYEVCTAGVFATKIHLKNFSLAQLGLIGLVLRDLHDGWFSLGFAKSRGLGLVKVEYQSATVAYPGCVIDPETEKICLLGSRQQLWDNTNLLGAGVFLEPDERQKYGFPEEDQLSTPVRAQLMDLGFGVQLVWKKGTVHDLFERSVKSWGHLLGVAP